MRTFSLVLLASVLAAQPPKPRHSFQPEGGALTGRSALGAERVAEGYLRSVWKDAPGAYVVKQYTTAHNGVTHVVYGQRFDGLEVFDTEVTINVDAEGRVLNSGGQLYNAPAAGLRNVGAGRAVELLKAAMREVDPERTAPVSLLGTAKDGRTMRFARGPAAIEEATGRPGWLPVKGRLRPVWRFGIAGENGADYYSSTVESITGEVVHHRNLTRYQRAPRARVFTGTSPQPNPTPGVPGREAYSFVNRVEVDLTGAASASPRGWVSGNTTSGNNVHAVHNPLGITFLPSALPTVANADGHFLFPLETGPGQGAPTAYKDAAVTNLFYWANRAHDFFYALGFDEASGNYQVDNFGRGGAAGDPMLAHAHFGAVAQNFAAFNNAFYTARSLDDGAPSGIHMYLGLHRGTGIYVDGSYDSEVIVHEYTHGVSLRLVRQLNGGQGNAMGEAWSDFFALEMLTPEGAPVDGLYPTGEYLFQNFGNGLRTRPFTTRMDVNPLTYAQYGRVIAGPEVHADGEIWVQCLWDMRANLIRQFGEREGRRRVRLLVIDGMKLSPPNPTMVEMRDAILLADRVDFRGESQDAIWTAFAKRGLGALAQSGDPDSAHVAASFEKPSPKGALRFYEDKLIQGEQIRLALADSNNTGDTAVVQFTGSSGDLETLSLHRDGSIFTGSLFTNTAAVTTENRSLTLIPGDAVSAYYVDQDTGAGPQLITATVSTTPDYSLFSYGGPNATAAGAEAMLFARATTRRQNGTALVALNFDFPFYGQKYRLLRVYGDGLVTFEQPDVSGCKDESAFSKVKGIAPLWMELMYANTATREENVFITRGAGVVTFRWAAQTQRLLVAQAPDAVDFTLTLHEDGRIFMNYGEGNRNLVNSQLIATALGCESTAPTIGLSAGHDTHLNIHPFLHGRSSLDKTYAGYLPPFGQSSIPELRIETPRAGEAAPGFLTVSGLVWDADAPLLRTDLLIDGVAAGTLTRNVARPDFCATRPVPGCPTIGFSRRLDLGALGVAPGSHTLQVRATSVRGGMRDSETISFTSTAAPPAALAVGAVEGLANGTELAFPLTFRGWAHSGATRILGVDILIDGFTGGPATYGGARPDICAGLAPAPVNCPGVGLVFAAQNAAALPLGPGLHRVQWRVRDENGRVSIVPETPVTFRIGGAANLVPTGVLESPKPNDRLTGIVPLRGYAWDPDGRITAVTLVMNGIGIMGLNYGAARPDACATLTDVARCPGIGFEGSFDTRLLPNGTYSFGIQLVDEYGAVVTIPFGNRSGMNVTIEN